MPPKHDKGKKTKSSDTSSPPHTSQVTSSPTHSGELYAESSSYSFPPSSLETMDVINKMFEYMDRRDEERRREDEERRKEENLRQQEQFKALVEALTTPQAPTPSATGTVVPNLPSVPVVPSASQTPKVTINLPPPLMPDVTFRQ